eukprot:8268495-Karenia_brevis.AAC.1
MIFHARDDSGVDFSDGHFCVDGVRQSVCFYDIEVPGAEQFKYLGVMFDCFGTVAAHLNHRLSRTGVAAN